jgi:hypothetical protein
MKDLQINIRVSEEDRQLLRKAAQVFSSSTGEKENISKTIRVAVRKFAGMDPEHDPSFGCNKN